VNKIKIFYKNEIKLGSHTGKRTKICFYRSQTFFKHVFPIKLGKYI